MGHNTIGSLKIAILGTRGIPARYGGFETFAEELSKRLVARGHQVSVYARKGFFAAYTGESVVFGARVIATPTIFHKYLETPLHALTSFIDLFRRRVDVVLLCNAANAPLSWLLKLRGVPFAINVDGIERKRAKWNIFGRIWYLLGEYSTLFFADRIIADAEVISEYWTKRYGIETSVIAYGANPWRHEAGDVLATFGLKPANYILYVSRLEPENNALGVIEAYRQTSTELPLVIVGDAPYADAYKQKLKALATEVEQGSKKRVVFTWYQFGDAYRELQSNCTIYIQATEVGGTHPALIESMAFGNCVVANGTPENIEVLGDAGVIYRKNDFTDLAAKLSFLLNDNDSCKQLRKRAAERAAKLYNWELITDQYERLLGSLCTRAKVIKPQPTEGM